MKAFLLTLLHLTVMTATLCGPGPAPMPATGTTPWQSAWLLGAR